MTTTPKHCRFPACLDSGGACLDECAASPRNHVAQSAKPQFPPVPPAQAGEGLTEAQYKEILQNVLSRRGLDVYLKGFPVRLGPHALQTIIDKAYAAGRQHAPAEPVGEVKTWQERVTHCGKVEDGLTRCHPGSAHLCRWCKFKARDEEIAELRAALAEQQRRNRILETARNHWKAKAAAQHCRKHHNKTE